MSDLTPEEQREIAEKSAQAMRDSQMEMLQRETVQDSNLPPSKPQVDNKDSMMRTTINAVATGVKETWNFSASFMGKTFKLSVDPKFLNVAAIVVGAFILGMIVDEVPFREIWEESKILDHLKEILGLIATLAVTTISGYMLYIKQEILQRMKKKNSLDSENLNTIQTNIMQ